MIEREEPFVSIVIPFYNAEKYLHKCIDSILRQSYNNFEVIAINDGSTDNTGKYLKILAKKDYRVKYFEEPNMGRSVARNKGISLSKGDYITFVDSDDYVSTDYLKHLISGIAMNADIVMINKVLVDINNKYLNEAARYTHSVHLLDTIGGLECVLNQTPDNEVWGKIFKKELFRNVKFPENRIYEDLYVTLSLICNAKKIVFCDYPDYFYVQRKDNTINSDFTLKKMDILYIGDKVKETILDKFPNLKIQIFSRLFAAYSNVWMQIDKKKNLNEYYKMWNQIKKIRKQLLFKKIKNKKVFFGLYISLFGPQIYRKVYSALRR